MSSFSKMAFWPTGYFRAYARWLLRERRDVASRIRVLEAERTRTGFVQVLYRETEGVLTEERMGFAITHGSSLVRLCQAYIANGGNPLDVSTFMHPDNTVVIGLDDVSATQTTYYQYPHGGVIAPRSVNPNDPVGEPGDNGYGPYQGGWLDTDRYYPARMGGRMDRGMVDSDAIVQAMHQIRGWANPVIKERLQDMEWRIVKLADLEEQLRLERDHTLLRAFGGSLDAVMGDYAEDRVVRSLLVQNLIADMNKLVYQVESDGAVLSYAAGGDVPLVFFTFPSVPSEMRDPLGG